MKKLVAPLGALLVAACLAGCAPTAAYVNARKTETAMATAVMNGYELWRQADLAHQQQILASSPSLRDYQASVAAWRNNDQAQVDKAFKAARDALYAFDQSLNAASSAQQKEFGAALAHVIGAVTSLGAILARYGVKLSAVGL